MCKYALIALVVFLIVLMVVGAVIVQVYGWTGFLVLLGAMALLLYLAVKLAPRVMQYLLLRPIRRMGQALRGGRIVVHSIQPAEAPEGQEDDDGFEAIEDQNEEDEEYEDENEEIDDEEAPIHLDWYRVEFTVIPPGPESSEGTIRHREGWMPNMIGARHLRPGDRVEKLLQGNPANMDFSQFGLTEHGVCEIWDGSEYVPPNESVFGEQRLRLHFGVARQVNEVTIVYANFTEIGKVSIPRINITPDATL